jgi:hypothetical protein
MIRMLTDPTELETYLGPVLATNGSEIPAPGCYIAAVEFDECGQVVGYQMLQNAIFLEGLWARDHSAHLRSLYNLAVKYAAETMGVKHIMTMTRTDEGGQRIGRLAQALGFIKQDWNIFRRKL